MFAPRIGGFHGYHFSDTVTVRDAVRLREAIEAMPAWDPPTMQERYPEEMDAMRARNLLPPSDPDSDYATHSPFRAFLNATDHLVTRKTP
jgi:hypothetical protein